MSGRLRSGTTLGARRTARRGRSTRWTHRQEDGLPGAPIEYSQGAPPISLKAVLPGDAATRTGSIVQMVVQRQSTTAAGSDPVIERELQARRDKAADGMKQDADMMRRAHSARLLLLLSQRPHGPLLTLADVDAFFDECNWLARYELTTLGEFSPAGAEFALAFVPKGFPLTWAGRVKDILSLKIPPETIVAEAKAATEMLDSAAANLPPGIESTGIPVPWKEATTLKPPFRLRVDHATAPTTSAVSDYARVGIRYTQLRWMASFAFSWESSVEQLRESVADGTIVIKTDKWKTFVDQRGSFLRDLPARARDRISRNEAELSALGTGMVEVNDAVIALGMTSGLTAVLAILGGWRDVTTRFDAGLATADERISKLSNGGRFLAALRWLWANAYLSGAAGAQLAAMLDQLPETLGALGAILIAGMIPPLNVPLAVLLATTAAKDAIGILDELAETTNEVFQADSVVALQRASSHLAASLTGLGITVLTVLITEGVARSVARLRGRAQALQEADPTLSRTVAERRAFEQMSAEERAALESPKFKAAKRVTTVFEELGGFCSIGSVICRQHSKVVLAEAGAYPTVRGVPMPRGIFKLQKSLLVAAERRPYKLQQLCMAERKRWKHFDNAVKAAGGKWPVDANGNAWQVHHIKPVQFGGDSRIENLFPLPAADHVQYSKWWSRLYWAYRRRFTDEDWELIYWNKRNVYGSEVRKTPVK